jgi:hypothetical protein
LDEVLANNPLDFLIGQVMKKREARLTRQRSPI